MNEAEWLACTDPGPMLEFLHGRGSKRKLRLFAVYCCRRFLHLLPPLKSIRKAVDVAERQVEGLASREEAGRVYEYVAYQRPKWATFRRASEVRQRGELDLSNLICEAFYALLGLVRYSGTRSAGLASSVAIRASANPEDERAAHCAWLRDLFGPLPFRAVALNPAWLTGNGGSVRKLADPIYDYRRFGDLPILADALE